MGCSSSQISAGANMILTLFYNVFGFLKMENWSTNHREEIIKPCSQVTKFSLRVSRPSVGKDTRIPDVLKQCCDMFLSPGPLVGPGRLASALRPPRARTWWRADPNHSGPAWTAVPYTASTAWWTSWPAASPPGIPPPPTLSRRWVRSPAPPVTYKSSPFASHSSYPSFWLNISHREPLGYLLYYL